MSVVSLATDGPLAVITVNHPPVNALSQPVRAGLLTAFDTACKDDAVQAIVLRCDGRTFIAGADIREFGRPPEAPFLPDVVARIERAGKPVVAAIHGTALGGGLEIAMGCHYRVAARSASIGLPEVKLGLLPGAGGTQQLPRLAGVERALEMMLSGKPVAAREALAMGVIDELADDDALPDAARRFAARAVARGPRRTAARRVAPVGADVFAHWRQVTASKARGLLSPQRIIDCVEIATQRSFEDGLRYERAAFLECLDSPQSDGLRHAFFAERAVRKVPGIERDTPLRPLQRVAVQGAGTMGSGIAYALLNAGFDVYLLDNDEAGLLRGIAVIRELFDAGIARGKLGRAAADEAMARLSSGTDDAQIAGVDLVIEAVFESMAVKRDVFGRLGATCRPEAILASNTSTLDIDAIAAASGRPGDVIGLHFFSPAHVMRLVEIVRGRQTSADVIATSMQLARDLGKIGVVVGNGFGFVGNRMLYGYGRENQLLLLEGAAPERIDRVLCEFGMAMGPNAVGDLAGLDVGYKARRERSDLPDDPRYYRVADMLVEAGRLGRKTGLGIYRYTADSRQPEPDPDVRQMIRAEAARLGVAQRDISDREIVDRCILGLVTEGARILEEGIAQRAGDIDVIWINGYGFPRHRGGPMHYADRVGAANILERVLEFRARFGAQYWSPPALLEQLARDHGRFGDRGR
ncbi:MAG TPA: 3-hydroxyacyl-CoA dehydrogenase NAD-binding domain-containing protein [Woeseiaceae bacterium]|nr:3-hydroxyacyl-CoA dehydrogenase NAD-binding domain-containing protein [Woeseiaceae bacterium]